MSFNSFPFAFFFVIFFLVYRFVTRNRKQQIWFIALGSLFYYSTWDFRYIPLLLSVILVNYFVCIAMEKRVERKARKPFLAFAVTFNILLLGYFKYANFFMGSAVGLYDLFGFHVKPHILSIVLPLGISFYTFQALGYVIDCYRGDLKVGSRFVEFLAAVSFFPQISSGPIIRSGTLFPQFEEFKRPGWNDFSFGFTLICVGLLKKSVADVLGLTVDTTFGSSRAHLTALEAWTGTFAFIGQIYGDFSGYTDMAIGFARILGYKLPDNFNSPFLATSMVDYWRRWHISLSEWFRDYVYTPLAFSLTRRGIDGVAFGLLVTMTLVGIWHRSSWAYLGYGLYNGALMVLTYKIIDAFPGVEDLKPEWLVRSGKILLTTYLVAIGDVMSRCETFSKAWNLFLDMHRPAVEPYSDPFAAKTLVFVVALVLFCYAVGYFVDSKKRWLERPTVAWAACGFFIICSFYAYSVSLKTGIDSRTFIYFFF